MSPETPSFLDPVENLPRAGLRRMQESLLLQILPYAYNRSPLVREAWDEVGITPSDIRSIEDFRDKVPFIDKDRIRAFRDRYGDPFGGLKCAEPPHLCGVGFTSGTTGDATPMPRTLDSTPMRDLKRAFWHIGLRPGDHFSFMLFTFREGHSADRWTDCGFKPILFQHHPAELGRLFEASARFQPKVLFMLSTPMVLALHAVSKKQGIDLKAIFAGYHGAVFGGEAMSRRARELTASWGLEIFEFASFGDVSGAMECRAHDGLHTWEDFALVEHFDASGGTDDPAGDGNRGELVVTSLMDDVAPLIRYRTDDLVTWTARPCTCGRTHGRMHVVGRKGDEVVVSGRSVMPRDILPVLEDVPECVAGLFQLIRPGREVDVLRLRVGFEPELLKSSQGELAGRLRDRFVASFEVKVEVELQANAELLKLGPPQKIPRVAKQ